MPIDRDLLRQLKAKPAAKQAGVGALPRGIHKTPGLREWVTLESVALPPVPFNQEGQWRLISLLVVPTRLEDGSKGWFAPWGAVEWSWSEKQVIQKIDLRNREDTASLRYARTISARPTLDPWSRTQRENALFSVLERILSTSPTHQVNLVPLAAHYAGLLPADVYAYYYALIPQSREWLRPDVTALPLKTSGAEVQQKIPHQNLVYPADLTEYISLWLRKCLTLAELSRLENVVSELQTLETRWHLPGFRLAIVGEFNRGKSTLINRLLGRCIVPADTLSATAILTSIIAGSEDCMEVRFSPKFKEVRPLEASSWNDLTVTDSTGHEREVRAGVQLILDDAWLRSLDIELIDTPGMGDLNRRREQLLLDLLNQCDAVVMVINAISPFSMTEMAFLKQQLMGRHINRILILVSHLDEIALEQRTRLLAHMREKVAEVSESLLILPLHPLERETTETEVLEAVRTEIAAMVSKGDRRAWRSQQVARQLADRLSHLIQVGENAIAAARMNPSERERALQQLQQQNKSAELHWQKIQRELHWRSEQCYQQLKQKILNAKIDLMDLLLLELDRTSNPKFWWERELPLRLRREFPALGRQSEDFLMRAIARDFEWLQKEVSCAFSVSVTSKIAGASVPTSESLGVNYQPSQLELFDLQRYRFLTRMGSSAAMIGGYVFGGPIGILASLGTTLLSERFINEKLEDQRKIIAQELQARVERSLDEYCKTISERLQNLYNQLSQDAKHQQDLWQLAQNTAISKNNFVGTDEPVWQQTIEQASALRSQILQFLKEI